MSFRCQNCQKAQPNGAKPHRVVTATRRKDFTIERLNKEGKRIKVRETGEEIAAEANLCDKCHDERQA